MAFRKVLALALLCSAAKAAPQQLLRTVHAAAPGAVLTHAGFAPQIRTVATHSAAPVQLIRTHASAPQVVSHAVHAAPTVVRTVAAAPQYEHVEEQVEVAEVPRYSFGYSVADTRSGDSKTREETRDGDVVTGSYSVADPDGRIRRVQYTADKYNGFQATVTYDGEQGPPAIPIDSPTLSAAPAVIAAEPIADAAVIAERTNEAEEEEEAEEEPASRSNNQATVARFFQPAAVQAFRTFQPAATTVLRSDAVHQVSHAVPTATHAVHALPATTVVRQAAFAQPQFVHAAAPLGATVVRHASPAVTASHVVSSPQVVRTFAAAPTFATHAGLRALPVGTQFVHA